MYRCLVPSYGIFQFIRRWYLLVRREISCRALRVKIRKGSARYFHFLLLFLFLFPEIEHGRANFPLRVTLRVLSANLSVLLLGLRPRRRFSIYLCVLFSVRERGSASFSHAKVEEGAELPPQETSVVFRGVCVCLRARDLQVCWSIDRSPCRLSEDRSKLRRAANVLVA